MHRAAVGTLAVILGPVHPGELSRGAALTDDLDEHADGIVGVALAGDPEWQAPRGSVNPGRPAAPARTRTLEA